MRQRKTEEQEKNFNFVHMGVGHRNRRLPKCPKPLKQMIIYENRYGGWAWGSKLAKKQQGLFIQGWWPRGCFLGNQDAFYPPGAGMVGGGGISYFQGTKKGPSVLALATSSIAFVQNHQIPIWGEPTLNPITPLLAPPPPATVPQDMSTLET